MSASNGVHIMGRITRDLELRHTQSGTAVYQFCVAVTRSFKDANGEYQSDIPSVWVTIEGEGRKSDGHA